MNKASAFIIVLLLAAGGAWWWARNEVSLPVTHGDLIVVTYPRSNQIVHSPLEVRGRARGNWFFEASFPIDLWDANGRKVVSSFAIAQSEWMTEDYVPFSVVIPFALPATPTGTLILHKDNPSGLPEHDDEVRIPVRFR
ncbi:MAG: Gmad2 immunoglobulin-like domain-containing protein [Patescibacteria group bacterium]